MIARIVRLVGLNFYISVSLGAILLGFSVVVLSGGGPAGAQVAFDWQEDWEVQSGFDIGVDSEGFAFPSSIAFVPSPGNSPKDPLYFVTELRGRVKVVTNDRTVFTFAEINYDLQPNSELPAIAGEVGMAGVCLDPKHGSVFVTFSYRDSERILRNNIVRFDTEEETFSVAPQAQVDFTDVFLPYRSVESHQIGPCQVNNSLLYVSVADGRQVEASQQLGSVLGKVLRMTLEGKPVPTNPFYEDQDIANARNYVWAMGVRNPFGLKGVGEHMFAADNGINIDRFLRIEKGANYLWNGTDASIGLNAEAVFATGNGVGQLDYNLGDSGLFPSRFGESFFLAITGGNQAKEGNSGIAVLPYDIPEGVMRRSPTPLLQHIGEGAQIIAGMAFGPDGLYFAPMLPTGSETTAVLKVRYDPDAGYPFTFQETKSNPIQQMTDHGCFACHTLNGNGGGDAGPVLDRSELVPRVMARLNSSERVQVVRELDRLSGEPFVSFREARREVQEAQGLEQVRLWLEYRIQEPRFDDAGAQMPNLGIAKETAGQIAAFLIREEEEVKGDGFVGKTVDSVRDLFPSATRANAKKIGIALVGLGFVAGGVFGAVAYWLLIRLRRKTYGG